MAEGAKPRRQASVRGADRSNHRAIERVPIPGFGLIVGIFAVTKGAAAAADLRRSGQGGRGRAIAGEVMGVIAIAVSIALPIVFGFLL
jgi:hypothetical protein